MSESKGYMLPFMNPLTHEWIVDNRDGTYTTLSNEKYDQLGKAISQQIAEEICCVQPMPNDILKNLYDAATTDREELIAEWNTLAEGYPDHNRRFIALYSDGSGSVMFYRCDSVCVDQDGDDHHIDDIDNGDFFFWYYLPDNFKMWCEMRSDDPVIFPYVK